LSRSCSAIRLIEDPLEPPSTRAPVSIDIADQTVGGPEREVIARDAVLPPVRFDAPFAQLFDDGMPMPRDDERDELTLIPDQPRGERFGEQPHAMTSTHSLARSGSRASGSATRARSTTPGPSFSRR